jgi:hypothetical protein
MRHWINWNRYKVALAGHTEELTMNHDKYLRVVYWARTRYTDKAGLLVISKGGSPSMFSRIESAAWNKYIMGA